MSEVNDYFALNSRLYIEAVDKFEDHIAILEELRTFSHMVTEDEMRMFLKHAPDGWYAAWEAFEKRSHADTAPKEYSFLDYFNEVVANAKVSEERIIIPPDIGCAV